MKNVIKTILVGLIGAGIGAAGVGYFKSAELREQKNKTTKYLTLFRNANQFIVVKQRKLSVADYLDKEGIHTVAIYGMSHLGQRIIDELNGSDIKVEYGIDKRADRLTYELPIYKPDDELPETDAILVTAYDFDEIEEEMSQRVQGRIIDFNDMIYHIS